MGLPSGPAGSMIAGMRPFGFNETNAGSLDSLFEMSIRWGSYAKPSLLQHDRDLDAIGRGSCVELQAIGMRCRPALRDRKGREVWHGSAILVLRRRLTGMTHPHQGRVDDRIVGRRGHRRLRTGPAQRQRQ